MVLKRIINEIRRRNVFKAALSYLIFSWVFIQASSILFPAIGLGQQAIRNTLIVLIICFPLWIVFAYIFEWTPEGFKKTREVERENSIVTSTGKKMNNFIIVGLTLAVVLLVSDRIFHFTGSTETTRAMAAENLEDKKSIAVLAFADMSPKKDQEYFSDGISEEILNLLAKIPDLKVISRTSSFSYKGKEENIKQIGEELQVSHILEGSIRKSGNTFRITAQLIDVNNGSHIWSETYDREMSDIFKIQDEIAGRVARQLKITLLGDIASATANPEAYNLFLQAKQLSLQSTAEANKNAGEILRQSIAIDSSYAPAWTYLSKSNLNEIYKYGTLAISDENISNLMNTAKKAIQIDPNYAYGYAQLAYDQMVNFDFHNASENIKKALALSPDNSLVTNITANIALYFGKLDKSLSLRLKSIELDPLDYKNYMNLSLTYQFLKDFEKAQGSLRTFLLHYPGAAAAHSVMSTSYLYEGNYIKALGEIEKETDPFWKLYRKNMILFAMGRKQEADSLLVEFVNSYGNDSWPNIALVYAFRKNKDEAFKWLDLAFENKDGSLLEILNNPEMENLWGDPRWNAFIKKLGLPKDHGFHMD